MAKPKLIITPDSPLNTYGIEGKPGWDQHKYNRIAFARRIGGDFGAPPRLDLFKKIADQIAPNHFEWHLWTDKIVESLCDCGSFWEQDGQSKKSIVLTGFPGCSSAGKTYNVSSFATIWWACSPFDSSVTFLSTSKQSLRRRAWAEVSRINWHIKPQFGNFVDSRMVWQSNKGDDKNAIIGRAIEDGSVSKVADDLKGVHTSRQMVVIDEATSVPSAIYEACANLYSYPDEFILVLIGNPLNRLDQFGRFCEPDGGWDSVSVESGEWDAAPQKTLGGRKPRVVTFDAEKSPNIVEGRIVSRHLPTKESVEAAKRASGGGNSPLFWQNFRGFWPPEGLSKTVFSESAILEVDAYGKLEFTGESFSILGSFDHARDGGDRPCLRFAKFGTVAGGFMGVELLATYLLATDSTNTRKIDFQLADQIRLYCNKFTVNGLDYTCQPENLIIDATGGGADFTDIIQQIWSNNIQRVVFGGSPSTDQASLEDARPAKEVYLNKRCEMYFRASNFLDAGQFKGLDRDTASELISVQYVDMRPDGTSSPKIKLMSKLEYKKLFKKSPDLADSAVMIIELARRKGFKLEAIGDTVSRFEKFKEFAVKAAAVHEDGETYQKEEPEVEEYEYDEA